MMFAKRYNFIAPVAIEYYMRLAKRYNFIAPMTPFANRRHEPAWFKREFPARDPTHQVKSIEMWKAFLIPKLLSTITSSKKTQVRFVGYQLNLVARQFGHFQFKNKSYFQRKKELCLSAVKMTEETYLELLAEQAKNSLGHAPKVS